MSTISMSNKRELGRTGIQITPIGLGVMELSGGGGMLGRMFPIIPVEDKNAIIKAALDGGINFFDTAEIYGNGISEQSLSTGLKAAGKANGEVVVATKWFPLFRTAGNIAKTIDVRLRHLGGYRIDLYMVHQPLSFSSIETQMDAMADLVAVGKIRSVGVSNFSAEWMRRAFEALQRRGLPLACNQVHYSLLHRNIENDGILDTAKELGVTITAYTPLERGLLSGKYHKNPELLERMPSMRRGMMRRGIEASRPLVNAMEEIGAGYKVTPAQVALNWLIHFKGDTVVTIPGATKVRQVQEAAGAMKFHLTEAEMGRLDELSRAAAKS